MEAVGERLRPCAAELYAVLQGLELSVERGWGMVAEVAGERMVSGSEDCWAEGILIG